MTRRSRTTRTSASSRRTRSRELKRFFEDYKTLENKQVTIEDFEGPFDAVKTIRQALVDYRGLKR